MERHVEALAWDFLRHDFCGRELRVLLLILFRLDGSGVARFERRVFEERLGLRSDKALLVLRDLERARVLKPGWEDGVFVIEPRSDFWKRAELASSAVLAQGVLPMESGDAGVRFAQAVAQENFGVLAARASDGAGSAAAVRNADAGVLPGASVPQSGECFPKVGNGAARDVPQSGERVMEPALAQAGAGIPKMGKMLPQNGDSNVVQRLNVSSKERTLERCNVSTSPAGRGMGESRQSELIARVRAAVGETDWGYWGGAWVTHGVRKCPDVLERALADFECTRREGQISIKNPGAYLWRLFSMFGGKIPAANPSKSTKGKV